MDRHGPDSIVARSRIEARVDIYSAVVRTLRRVSAARPNQQPFSVDTVLLGCATLIRPQGDFSSPDAPQVLRQAVTRAVDDGEHPPHSLIIDGAQVTGLTHRQLQAALSPLAGRPSRCVLLQAPRTRRPSTHDEDSDNDLVIDWTTDIEQALTPQCSCP